jgi:hypothetical protein
MADKLISEGICTFCSKTYKKGGINRHLIKELEEMSKNGKPGKSFLLKVEPDPSWGRSPYFLSIWMDGEMKMDELDNFLRKIWLECCGHMSAFVDVKKRAQTSGTWGFFDAQELLEKGKVKQYEKMMEEQSGEIPMSRKVKNVFEKGKKLEYQYDFGSTTQLQIEVVAEYPVKAEKKYFLLSRNEPLKIKCSSCSDKMATQLCSVCAAYDNDAIFCDSCAKKHAKECDDFDDYAAMPVVNSPRMGVCAYDGGMIDKKRDRVAVAVK